MLEEVTQDTPIEPHLYRGLLYYVKREDLCMVDKNAPPFAKPRGLYPRMVDLKTKGIETVGYMETAVSMAAWAISYFAHLLDMKAVIYMPNYKDGLRLEQERQVAKWQLWGAKIELLDNPNRLQINYYRARKHLKENYKNAVMLEHGIPLQETIIEVSNQVALVPPELLGGTIVSCIGSGVMVAGVLRGLHKHFPRTSNDIKGILVAPKNVVLKRNEIIKRAGIQIGGLTDHNSLQIIDAGYQYTDKEECSCPFPCNPYYDRKAFKWMMLNLKKLKPPVLFWSIGA